jgi:predicted DNA-binding protein
MADTKDPDRKLVSVTMRTELYQRLIGRCKALDVPASVYVRQLIQDDLDRNAA